MNKVVERDQAYLEIRLFGGALQVILLLALGLAFY
jgi:hypothetical protein